MCVYVCVWKTWKIANFIDINETINNSDYDLLSDVYPGLNDNNDVNVNSLYCDIDDLCVRSALRFVYIQHECHPPKYL